MVVVKIILTIIPILDLNIAAGGEKEEELLWFGEDVKIGTRDNFKEVISEGKSLVMFYAPW